MEGRKGMDKNTTNKCERSEHRNQTHIESQMSKYGNNNNILLMMLDKPGTQTYLA